MEWVAEFYEKQNAWSGVSEGEPNESHFEKAGIIEELLGAGAKRVLELGAGGGQVAIAAASRGHSVVAIELVAPMAEHGQQLAAANSALDATIIHADFYAVELKDKFDAICYWDGFGIGTDEEQRTLLKRIAGWLKPAGSALLEISTPWYAASVHGRGWTVGEAERRYSFDAAGCRWEDSWWPISQPEQLVKQSIRCYSPADLELLLQGTSLEIHSVKAGGTVDWEQGKWLPSVPLGQAMQYVARIVKQA